eukprot:2713641-Alexandrium_andersonii.AAC.1
MFAFSVAGQSCCGHGRGSHVLHISIRESAVTKHAPPLRRRRASRCAATSSAGAPRPSPPSGRPRVARRLSPC